MAAHEPDGEEQRARRLAYANHRHDAAAVELARAYVGEGRVPEPILARYMQAAALLDAETFAQAERDRAAGITQHPSTGRRLRVVTTR